MAVLCMPVPTCSHQAGPGGRLIFSGPTVVEDGRPLRARDGHRLRQELVTGGGRHVQRRQAAQRKGKRGKEEKDKGASNGTGGGASSRPEWEVQVVRGIQVRAGRVYHPVAVIPVAALIALPDEGPWGRRGEHDFGPEVQIPRGDPEHVR